MIKSIVEGTARVLLQGDNMYIVQVMWKFNVI